MVRLVTLLAAAALMLAGAATAGSPHFVKSATSASVAGDTLTVSGKVAGLGDEAQVHIVLTATAECVNRGGHNPNASNKQTVSAAGDFPVQNGKANFTLSVTATFQPDCAPPMSVAFTDVRVTDTTHGITLGL